MNIGIVGTGQMGILLSLVFSNIGQVVLVSRHPEIVPKKLKRAQKITSRDTFLKQITLDNISITENFEALKNCEFIIEAVAEDSFIKKEILQKISETVPVQCVMATNTSTLSITELSTAIQGDKTRFLGCHFFNPPTTTKLLEVVTGEYTRGQVTDYVVSLTEKMGFYTIRVEETPGFIVNRGLFLMLNEAVCMLDEKVSSREEIDNAFKLGLNHPMGPLTLCDFIGLDTCLAILNNLYKEFGDTKYRPSKLLVKKVRAGKLGRKTGEGFRTYRTSTN